ncbi:MAG TPA: alpha/beta fold hydrolase [Variovorax sp.]|nr:alpha/beta fold hydrolase [Variovorax sp.]
MDLDESTLCFGPEQSLIGVLARPAGGGAPARVGCLLLNVGVNYRIGPRRINVKMARQLAAGGIPSLRFDLSGVGDSRASAAHNDFRQQALIDMKAALDELQAATGLARFVVVGICSGGVNGLALALADPRVIGLLMFDSYVFLTKGVKLERKLRRWAAFPFNASVRRSTGAWNDWMGWARAPLDADARRKALDRVFGRFTPRTTEDTGILTADTVEYTAADFTRDMTRLVERGVDIYLMYSAMLITVDHGGDLLKGLGQPAFLSRIRYQHLPDIDHTATWISAQRKLLDAICGWADGVSAAQPVPAPQAQRQKSAAAALAALERRLDSRSSA